MSRKSPDRRPTCGKNSIGDVTIFLGGCSGGARLDSPASPSSSYLVFDNVTVVPPLDGAHSASLPYARPKNNGDLPACGRHDDACGDGSNGFPFCDLPSPSEVNTIPGTNPVSLGGGYYNSFNARMVSGSQVTASKKPNTPCEEIIGMKRVVSRKYWQGRPAFNSRIWGQTDKMNWCCRCNSHDQDFTGETVKYLGITADATWETVTVGTGAQSFNAAGSWTAELDRHSGNYTTWTATTSSNAGVDDDPQPFYDTVNGLLSTFGNSNITQLLSSYCAFITAQIGFGETTSSLSISSYARESGFTVSKPDPFDGGVYWQISVDFAAGTYSKDTWGNAYAYGSGDLVKIQTSHEELLITDTSFTFDSWTFGETSDQNATTTYHYEATLYSPYYESDLLGEHATLLNYYKLGDDDLLPWRTDVLTQNVCPLVCYNENPTLIQPTLSANPLIPSTSSSLYDGSIIGIPSPLGFSPIWNPTHVNYEQCGDDCKVNYDASYGAWSTEAHTPNATLWVNKWLSQQMPQGAFVGSNFMITEPSSCSGTDSFLIIDNISWAAKYAEFLIQKPSLNYARKCGPDRLQIVANSNRCVVSSSLDPSGSFILGLEPTGDPTTLITGDKAWVFGLGSSYDGAWAVTKNGDYTVTLTTLLAPASQFDEMPFEDGGSGVIGKMGFFNVPGICGRVDITNIVPVVSSSFVTASLMEPAYLFASDSITIAGALGMTSANGVFPITKVLDSQTVILPMDGTGQHYTASSGQMYFSGSADWKWNDSAPKGDYVIKKWTHNFRDLGEYTRLSSSITFVSGESACNGGTCEQDAIPAEPRPYQAHCGLDQSVDGVFCYTSCSKYNPCKLGNVAYFSPNDESLLESKYNAKNFGFADVAIDGVYPTMWQGLVKQYDNDFNWQKPDCVCTQNDFSDEEDGSDIRYTCRCQYLEDDGTCQEDRPGNPDDPDVPIPCIKYYPMRPQVEPRCTVPDGDPTTYANQMGCLGATAFTSPSSCPDGVVCNPPLFGHYSYDNYDVQLAIWPYWDYYIRKRSCVCNDGRWADLYKQQLIGCNELLEAP